MASKRSSSALRSNQLRDLCPALVKSYERDGRGSLDEALRSLYRVWCNICRLDGAPREWVMEHLGAKPPTNPYADLKQARTALRGHPIHRWLTASLPQTMGRLSALPVMQEVAALMNLLSLLMQAAGSQESSPARSDKKRRVTASAVNRVQRALADGTLRLDHGRQEALGALLESALRYLTAPRPKMVRHPALLLAARELARYGTENSAGLIQEMAALADIECDEKTAQRYIKAAGEVTGGRTITHWHLVRLLTEDYRRSRSG